MTEGVVIQIITTLGLVVVAIIGNRKLNRIGSDAKATLRQTENDHQTSEFPNLRDELTATRGLVHGVDRKLDRAQSWLADLAEADRHHEQALDRKTQATDRALAVAVQDRERELALLRREIPAMIQREIKSHVADCPLRRDT